MKIITFYSYKGGTGRSLTLANVAYALRLTLKQCVGMIDLDCEAAALYELFKVNPGTANLLNLLLPKNRAITNVERHVVSIPVQGDTDKPIYLLPSVTDSALIDDIHWDSGVETFLREEVFPALERLFTLDYLLIDARAGVSSFAQFALGVADIVVIVGRADRQNTVGLQRMFRVCEVAGKPFKFVLSGCPSPQRNRGRLERFSREVGNVPDFVLPYSADLYFDEAIVAQDHPGSELAEQYGQIATALHEYQTDV